MKNLRPWVKIVAIMVAVLGLGFGIYKATNKGGSDSSGKNDSGGGLFSSIGNSDVITISVNTYAGFTPIVWLNGGLEPNENSVIYKEFGLKLKINIQDDFGASRAAFKKGENDIVYCTTDVVCTEMGAGSDMTDARQFMILNKSRGADAIVVNKNIKTVADLAGKKIAFAPGTASHTLLINTLETNGISPDKIQMVKVGNGMDAAAAFKAGQVDAAVVWAPDDADLVATIPGSKVIVSTKQASELITDGLLAKAEYLEKNKDKMTKLVSAILYANSLMNSDQATINQAAKYFAKAFGTDEAFCINGCKNIHFTTLGDEVNFLGLNSSYTGTTADQVYSKMSRIYEGLGLTKSPLSWRKVSDTSIIEELVASGWSKGDQSAEGAKTFTAPTKEVENSAAISNKKLTIQFATGSNVVDGDARSMIDREFVSIAKQFASMRIRVEGNTDWTGDENYNKKLSYNRAKAVVDYLVEEYGFDKNRFVVKGNGSEHAINAGVKGSNADYRTTDFELIEE